MLAQESSLPPPPKPLSLVPVGAAVASKCIMFGNALDRCYAGEIAQLTIQTRDRRGGSCPRGGETIVVRLRGPTDEKARVRDCGDGTYEVSFTTHISGTYSLSALLRGIHILGSPTPLRHLTAHTVRALAPPTCYLLHITCD